MKRNILAVSAVLMIALLVVVGTALADGHPSLFAAHLTGEPAGADTRGQGQANFMLSGDQLRFVMNLSKLEGDPLAAHIHFSSEPGGDGPPVISMCGAFGPPPVPVSECAGPGSTSGMVTLDSAQISELLTAVEEGRAYVNVHTTAFGPGEVRGQLVSGP